MLAEVIEKTIAIKVKIYLQPPFKIIEIDSKHAKKYKLSAKKDKNEAILKHND